MTNIELKELYDNGSMTLKQIKDYVHDLEYETIRGTTGNANLLFIKLNKTNNEDKDIYIGISGVYYEDTLPQYISF